MNEADRLAKAQAEALQAARASAEETNAREEAARRADAVAEARRLIPVALERLEATGYPGVEEVDVWERRRFGRARKVTRGGWQIASVTSMHFGEAASFPVHLLSTGKLLHYGDAKAPEQIIVKDHDTRRDQDQHVEDLFRILAGLRKLAADDA